MGTFFMAVCGWIVIQFTQRKEREESPQGSSWLDVLATSPSQKHPKELFQIIHSSHFAEMDIGDNAMLLNEMLSLIRPDMKSEEVIHVRTTLLAPIIQILALQHNVGGQRGQPIS